MIILHKLVSAWCCVCCFMLVELFYDRLVNTSVAIVYFSKEKSGYFLEDQYCSKCTVLCITGMSFVHSFMLPMHHWECKAPNTDMSPDWMILSRVNSRWISGPVG